MKLFWFNILFLSTFSLIRKQFICVLGLGYLKPKSFCEEVYIFSANFSRNSEYVSR